MPSWTNWSGKLTANPEKVVFLRSEQDAQAVAAGLEKGLALRVAGATHSHAPLVQTNGVVVDARGLAGVIEADTTAQTAWVWAGSRIHTLGLPLQQAGLALLNQGDIDEQAIAGATGTGTHGTGKGLKNLSSAVIGAYLVLADGSQTYCSRDQQPDLWLASRLHLGAFGIITRLHLQLRQAYRLQEQAWTAPLAEVMADLDHLVTANRHFEFFWHPQSDVAQAKCINETEHPAVYPLAEEGRRCAWNYEVLPNYRPHKHTEMEYSVPAEAGPACMADLQKLLQTRFTEVQWPIEYRTLARDDVWLSTAYERDTVTISVHQDVKVDETPYFKACEEIFLAYEGRPHWAKVNYLSGQQLADIHPRWEDWWRVRNRIDPDGKFLNEYLAQLR